MVGCERNAENEEFQWSVARGEPNSKHAKVSGANAAHWDIVLMEYPYWGSF